MPRQTARALPALLFKLAQREAVRVLPQPAAPVAWRQAEWEPQDLMEELAERRQRPRKKAGVVVVAAVARAAQQRLAVMELIAPVRLAMMVQRAARAELAARPVAVRRVRPARRVLADLEELEVMVETAPYLTQLTAPEAAPGVEGEETEPVMVAQAALRLVFTALAVAEAEAWAETGQHRAPALPAGPGLLLLLILRQPLSNPRIGFLIILIPLMWEQLSRHRIRRQRLVQPARRFA